jgi:photosystem II stability/assembly factor-like uncharacterized protein
MTDVSDWVSWGPNDHTETASWSPGQGRINAIAVDPNNPSTYYVGAPAGGIWKSTDSGENWTPLTDHLPQIGVSGIAVDPTNSDIIYIATGDDDSDDSYAVGVWKSTDGGTTWNNTGALSGNPVSMNDIFVFPENPEHVIVVSNRGIYKSYNGGTTWSRRSWSNVRGLRMRPNDPTTWYAITSTRFLKSTDSGDNFVAITVPDFTGSQRLEIAVTPANPDVVYIVKSANGNNFEGVFKSSDRGETFERKDETTDIFESNQAYYDLAITASDTDENLIFAGVLNIWKSEDGGDHFTRLNEWDKPNEPSYTHADIHNLQYINGKFFAGTDGGIYVSEDDGTNFTDFTKNLAIGQFYKISVSVHEPGNIAGGLQDNGGYALTNNEWRVYHGADGMDCVVNPTNPNNYLGMIQYGRRMYQSQNAGLTRHYGVNSPEDGKWVTPMTSDSQGNVYAGYSQLYRLENNSWQIVSNHNFSGDLDLITIDPTNGDNIYVSNSNRLFKSTDGGVNFETILPNLGTIRSIQVNSLDPKVVWIIAGNSVYKIPDIFASTLTYESIGTNTPSESKLSLKYHERSGNNTLYLGTSLGVYSINDDTTEWQTFDNNLPNVAIRDLEIHEEESLLYAATYGRGVFVSEIPRQLPPADVKILSIDNPDGIGCGFQVSPEITIKNQGVETLTAATFTYNYDGESDQVYDWSGSLNSEETITVTLPLSSIDFGDHSLNIVVTTSNDEYDTNNSLSKSFKVNESPGSFNTANSFEEPGDELLSESFGLNSSYWVITEPDTWLLNTPGSGSLAYMSQLGGSYFPNSTEYLYTHCYDLSQISSPILSFKMAFDLQEDHDYLIVEYSTDEGENWSILGNADDPNWYNSSSIANGMPGSQWTGEGEDSNALGGDNATVHDYSYNLGEISTETNILFRFVFKSDSDMGEGGVMLDDLIIEGVLSTIEDDFSNQILISPNPSDGIFNIKIPLNVNSSVTVYNYLGQVVKQEKNITNDTHPLDMSGFSRGVYIVRILSDGKTASKKIILK